MPNNHTTAMHVTSWSRLQIACGKLTESQQLERTELDGFAAAQRVPRDPRPRLVKARLESTLQRVLAPMTPTVEQIRQWLCESR